ncbi:DUF3987 domain-containing protein [Zunongwangia sp. F260]|uniref:DUF3987 domain-containing protein n=1 Tax=Autumnicola lenta TaxID=3075593 RepID=A0ABU3CKR6_9FLAO|nr:DUF3987 domain-containing protein [Zunongwangia sp. F260]MDT0646942.1 DUF3987 domain-containing protein [Zunongwangia sp. F260]
MRITKQEVFEKTNGGLNYIMHIFPELEQNAFQRGRSKPIRNHLRGERNPSLQCFDREGKYYIKDYGDPDYDGDAINLCMQLNPDFGFIQALHEVLKIGSPDQYKNLQKEDSIVEEVELPEGIDFDIDEMSEDELAHAEMNFLEEIQINYKDLKRFNSVFLKSYTFYSEEKDKFYRIMKKDHEVFIGQKFKCSVKVYKPYAKEYKHKWIGDYPRDYLGGLGLLKQLYHEVKNEPTDDLVQVVFCAGGKDMIKAGSLGFNAICLNSETSTFIPEDGRMYLEDIRDANHNNFELVIAYDDDETGRKSAKKFKERHKKDFYIRVVKWPEKLKKAGGKDLCDWITLGLPEEELIELLSGGNTNFSALSPVSPISPQAVNSTVEDNSESEAEESKDENLGSFEESKQEYPQEQVKEDPDDQLAFPLPVSIKEEDLPETLKKLAHPFDREFSEMQIISFITIFGGVFRNVVGRFRNDKLYTNLFTAIIGNPASGKGLIKWPNRIVKEIDQMLIRESRLKMDEYEERLEMYNKGGIKYSEVGPKPKLETFSIPADITPPMLVLQLFENNGTGFVFDTEMDTMVESAKGSDTTISPLLRKAYEGEPITLMRKTNREHLIVPEGRLSMLQSGTPRQFFRLIPDTENGLFSRIIPYILHSDLGWKDALDIDDFDYEGYFAGHAQKVLDYFIELESYEDPIVFELSKEQLDKFDKHFRARLQQAKSIVGLDVRATVIRLGAITVKIAIILSTLRKLDLQEKFNNSNLVNDLDLSVAFSISDIILNNVMDTLKMMKNGQIEDSFRGKKLEYFYELDNEFTFSQSQKVAEENGIKVRTAQKWVYQFRDQGFLLNPTKGHFKKII